MMSQIQRISQRRVQLIADIDSERINMRNSLAFAQQDLIYASLGFIAGRLLVRHKWLRAIILTAVAISANTQMATHSKTTKRGL
jgi:hypothetical protein